MKKPKDIPFEERWPIVTKILSPWRIRTILVVGCLWMGYQGIAFITGSYGWPLTIPQSTPETYQEYVRHWQEAQQLFRWVIGPIMIVGAVFVGRGMLVRLVRRLLNRRTEEVQIEE